MIYDSTFLCMDRALKLMILRLFMDHLLFELRKVASCELRFSMTRPLSFGTYCKEQRTIPTTMHIFVKDLLWILRGVLTFDARIFNLISNVKRGTIWGSTSQLH